MLDIKHNGAEKKVDGSVKETGGLLIISGKPKWVSVNDGNGYQVTFIDPRIKSTHIIQSIKRTVKSFRTVSTTDLTVDYVSAADGAVTILVSDATIIENDPVITITMYDVAAVATPSGMFMEINNAEVSFTDWKMTKFYEDPTIFSGTVAVKIEDSSLSAPSLATVVNKSFRLETSNIHISGIEEILPDGRLVCNAGIEMSPGVEDPVFPASASDAEITYVYIASDNIRLVLPEADAVWIEGEEAGSGAIFYEATFNAEVPNSVHVNDVIVVHGENGEEFPAVSAVTPTGEMPKMCSYIYIADGGAAQITAHWKRDTVPGTANLTAEVYVANYEAVDTTSGDTHNP